MPKTIRISTIVPIATYPFLARVNLLNTLEMAGGDPVDFVFLTSSEIHPRLSEAFESLGKEHAFRVVTAPIRTNLHLDLLDWSFCHADLAEYASLQHADFFWTAPGWLPFMEAAIESNPMCVGFLGLEPSFGGIPFCCHDFMGIYHVREIADADLSFQWGTHGKNFRLSPEVLAAMDQGRYEWLWDNWNNLHPPTRKLHPQHWYDGSQVMTLELWTRFRDRIRLVPKYQAYCHPYEFFRVMDALHRQEEVLYVNSTLEAFRQVFHHYVINSMIQCMFFDRRDVYKVVPIPLLRKLAREFGKESHMQGYASEIYDILLPYKDPDAQTIGESDDLGIRRICFNDAEYPNIKMM